MPDDGTFDSDMEWARAVDDRLRNIPTHADAVTHTARLVETHRITLPVGATGDNVAVARLHAEAYARAHGFALDACEFSVLGINGRTGVQFTVTVGVGDIHNDQRTPGVLDTWTWSARAQHGASLLRRVFPANALRGFAEGGPVAGGGAQAGTGPLPPWLRRTDPSFDDTASEDTDPDPTEG